MILKQLDPGAVMGPPAHWHILIIDNSPDDRANFKQMLQASSDCTCHFTEASTGSDGLALLRENQAQTLAGNVAPTSARFDCVLLSFQLPDLNATQWLNTLCSTLGMQSCPVVVMTDWNGADGGRGTDLLRAGAQDHFSKRWATPPNVCRAIENSIARFKLQQAQHQIHHQTRQALAESELRYNTLFNAIDEGYCVIQMIFDAQDQAVDYRFVEISQSFEQQTGLTGALGKTILQLIPELESSWLDAYGLVAKTGEPMRRCDHVQHMNRWFDVYAFRWGDPAKRQLGILFNNITERKIIEGRLHEAVAAADAANRAKSDFLTNMSHELRTPLNAILGFTQLLELSSPPPTPAQQQSLTQILKAGWYLLELVNGTLDLAAIEAGDFNISTGTVSLSDVLHDCAAIIAPLADKRRLSVTYPPPDPAHLAYADPGRVKQVLLNVLSNSVKYNHEGGTVTVHCSTRDGQWLRISVRDTGMGMTPHQVEHLFEPFNRLGQEHSGEVGTGIGLVLCKRLVEMMNGHIGADCVAGQGSDFWFELPLALAADTEHPALRPQLCPG